MLSLSDIPDNNDLTFTKRQTIKSITYKISKNKIKTHCDKVSE